MKKKGMIIFGVCLFVVLELLFILVLLVSSKDNNNGKQTLSTEKPSTESIYTTGTVGVTTEDATTRGETTGPVYTEDVEAEKETSSTFDMTTEYDDGEPYTGEDNN